MMFKSPTTATLVSASALVLAAVALVMQLTDQGAPPADRADQSTNERPISATAASITASQEDRGSDPAATRNQTEEGLMLLLEDQARSIRELERRLARFERVIRTSGLDAAALHLMPPPGSDAPLLAHIGEEYATRARFEERRKQLIERSARMRQRDQDAYGNHGYREIQELYEQARPRRGAATEEERSERQAALEKMMEAYPEAWSTNVAVAEHALSEAINRNTKDVETYYESLLSASPYPEVVTDQGINAIPTIQTYLARQYVQDGRLEDASMMLDALSVHGDNVILEPNEMGEPTARAAQDIVLELREQIAP